MRTLYHFSLCPFSRKLRVALKEKELAFELVTENFWERRPDFIHINPAVQVPVLKEADGLVLCDSQAAVEYLEEIYPDRNLIGTTPEERAETRRLIAWFDGKFYQEVTRHLLFEKIIKFLSRQGTPHSEAIRAGKANVLYHLDYIGFLTRQRKWLTGDMFGLADIAAACQISILDYLGDVPWDHYPHAKEWYALVKSRPSFRPLLSDRIPGFTPATHYANPDF